MSQLMVSVRKHVESDDVLVANTCVMYRWQNPTPGVNLDDIRNYLKALRANKQQLLKALEVAQRTDYSAFEGLLSTPLSNAVRALTHSQLERNDQAGKWMQAITAGLKIIKHDEEAGLTVLSMPDAATPGNPFSFNLSNDLFIRHFYDRLFDTLVELDRVALLGNTGVGRSWFELYCLLRVFHPTGPCVCLEGTNVPLWKPPTENWTPPEVVLRQLSPNTFEVYLVKQREMWTSTPLSPDRFIELFDSKKTLYLFEPRSTKNVEPCVVQAKTIAMLSPTLNRIHGFCKRGVLRYMPIWNLKELQAAAAHIRSQRLDSAMIQRLLKPDAVTDRFHRFGGILRYVLPESEHLLAGYRNVQRRAIADVDFNVLSKAGLNIDGGPTNVSHHVMQCKVDETDFAGYQFIYPGPATEMELQAKAEQREFVDNIKTMRECIQDKFPERMHVVVEPVTWEMLQRRVPWNCWPNPESPAGPNATYPALSPPPIKEYRHVNVANLREVEDGVLYVPTKSNFTLVEAFMKSGEVMIGFQCKSGKADRLAPRSAFSFRKELERLSLPTRWHIFIVATPLNSEGWMKLLAGSKTVQSDQACLGSAPLSASAEVDANGQIKLPSPWATLKRGDLSSNDNSPSAEDVMHELEGITFSVIHHSFDPSEFRRVKPFRSSCYLFP